MLRLTASEQIYQILKNRIISLILEPGQNLDIFSLASELGVSRSPIRDALIKLQEDNLVEIYPQRGTIVSKIDLEQVELERFLRITLETAIVPIFCKKHSEADLLKMNSAIGEQKLGYESHDLDLLLSADEKFHKTIYTSTSMDRLWKIYQSQCGNYQRIRRVSFQISEIAENVIREHQNMLDAFRNRNAQIANKLEYEHLNKLEVELTTLMKQHPHYFK